MNEVEVSIRKKALDPKAVFTEEEGERLMRDRALFYFVVYKRADSQNNEEIRSENL